MTKGSIKASMTKGLLTKGPLETTTTKDQLPQQNAKAAIILLFVRMPRMPLWVMRPEGPHLLQQDVVHGPARGGAWSGEPSGSAAPLDWCGVTKFIRIGIADKNDNPPYFDKALYEAEVDENEDIQHTVLTVTAKDHDE
ncbi:hypothetical protein FOCC_FOCC015208, partial [Frankliniella occidentalis]